MKRATIAIIRRGDSVLLGMKKSGEIGERTYNGPGGKNEAGESDLDCVIRETREELSLELPKEGLELVAEITFFAAGIPDFFVSVFLTDNFYGEPSETEDMAPSWFNIEDLPFSQMLESDRIWFQKAARGERFRAHVYYRERAKGFERIEFFPFEG